MSPPIPSRPQSIALIGGHPALDLINTVSWRHDPEQWRENLAVPLDLLTWASRAGVLGESGITMLRAVIAEDPEAATRVLREVHELRELLYRHLADCLDHRGAQQPIVQGSPLHRAFAEAIASSSLTGPPARWILEPRVPLDLPRALALHALDLVQRMPLDRLRRCEDAGCGWLFLDTTRNHSRRWCSSADCGNRDRARRHYARGRTTARRNTST